MIKPCTAGCNPRLSLFRSTLLCFVAALPAAGQIPEGFEIVHLMDEPADYSQIPSINNCGQVVFETRINQGPGDIFLYDNGHLVQITNDNVVDAFPDINADGTIVWSRAVGVNAVFEVAMYDDGEVSMLTDSPGSAFSPHMNDLGHVVWEEYPDETFLTADVFFYNGEAIVQITDNDFQNVSAYLNDQGVIVWAQRDFSVTPWDYRVMRYADGVTEELSVGKLYAQAPKINNAGWIVWQYKLTPDQTALNQWVDGEVAPLLDWGNNAQINEQGDMYFIRWHEDTSTWQAWLCLSCGPDAPGEPTVLQLTDDPFWNTDGDINDHGEVVWQAGGFAVADTYFLRRVRTGDADFDGDVDLYDLASFDDCMSGPFATDRLCDCRFLDLDHDRDVDWHDFGIFQRMYTGSK